MLENIELNPKAARLSVEYAKARSAVAELEGKASRQVRRQAKLIAVEVLHGHLVHKQGHTIVVFPDNSEARF